MGENYATVKRDIRAGYIDNRHRYKVLVPAQVISKSTLPHGEDLFMRLFSDFEIRRAFAIWISPDRSMRQNFGLSRKFTTFLSNRRHVSALAIDGIAAHPSANPAQNSINSRLLCDLLFRV
jgi:hypothetical protein